MQPSIHRTVAPLLPPLAAPLVARPAHRVARRLTLIGLIAGAVALVGLIAWTGYIRSAWDPIHGFAGSVSRPQSFIFRGFSLIALHPSYTLGAVIAGAVAAAGVALAFAVWRGHRWAYLVAGLGSLCVIAAPWLARAYVVHLETLSASRRWAARSPYVAASTSLAIAATAFLVLLATAAIVAFATGSQAARPPPDRAA